jgi:hypothetical protein
VPWSGLARAGAVGVALLLSSCCKVKGPCLPWVHVGETYSVKLVQHFEIRPADDANSLYPYLGIRTANYSCGQGLDLDVGSTVKIAALGEDKVQESNVCSCYNVVARVDVDGVKTVKDSRTGLAIGAWYLADQKEVVLANGCSAIYSIGIMPVSSNFIEVRSTMWQPITCCFAAW